MSRHLGDRGLHILSPIAPACTRAELHDCADDPADPGPCSRTAPTTARSHEPRGRRACMELRLGSVASQPSRPVSRRQVKPLREVKSDCVRSKRNRLLAYCLRMIFAQTHFSVCRDGKPVPAFANHALKTESIPPRSGCWNNALTLSWLGGDHLVSHRHSNGSAATALGAVVKKPSRPPPP